jgi:RNA polymerase sigma-70 factor, ECF subfamily
MTTDVEAALAEAFRADWGRVVANLIAIIGDWDLAENSTQDAFTRALSTWRRDGIPRSPQAWLTMTARNEAVDVIRRERLAAAKLSHLGEEPPPAPDDRLRLIFTCCHPAIALDSQVALALRTLCGLSVAEIAQAFMVGEAAMAERLVRAKQKIAIAGIPYRIPPEHLLADRLAGVRAVLYLFFNEGYAVTSRPGLFRPDLFEQAIELARMVCDLAPNDSESWGLYALLQLTHARAAARVDDDGRLVPLEEQDRTRWDQGRISSGVTALRAAVRDEDIGPYQLQAFIAAAHASAASASDTDWHSIVQLHDRLLAAQPTPAVALNRAAALAMRDGPQAGLDAVAKVDHPLRNAVEADMFRRLGRLPEAAAAYERAIDVTANDAERAYLAGRLRSAEAGLPEGT